VDAPLSALAELPAQDRCLMVVFHDAGRRVKVPLERRERTQRNGGTEEAEAHGGERRGCDWRPSRGKRAG
jgi:hypothetical protein